MSLLKRLDRVEKPLNLDKGINSYAGFLRNHAEDYAALNSDYTYIVFSYGSVVRLDESLSEPSFAGFDNDEVLQRFSNDFPHHLITQKSPTFHKVIVENLHDWKWSQTLKDAKEISQAYEILMKDGYPSEKNNASHSESREKAPKRNRIMHPLNVNYETVITLYNNATNDIATISCIPHAFDKVKPLYANLKKNDREQKSLDAIVSAHTLLATEQRKYDFMYPQVYARIGNRKENNKVTFY